MNKQSISIEVFKKLYPSEFSFLIRNRLLNRFCDDMNWPKLSDIGPIQIWTRELCLNEAKKHKNKTKWRLASSKSYDIAIKNGWFEECIRHMTQRSNVTKENCLKDALRFESETKWRKESSNFHFIAYKKGWLIDCTEHMIDIELLTSNNYWTIERVFETSQRYSNEKTWLKNSPKSYYFAKRNKVFDQCVAHMVRIKN